MIYLVLIAVFLLGLVSGFVACVFVHAPLVLRVEEAETMMRNSRVQLSRLRKDIDRLQKTVSVIDTQSRSEPFPKFLSVLDGPGQ